MEDGNAENAGLAFLFFSLIFTGIILLIMLLSLIIGLIVPAAEVHAIANDDFSAGFRVGDWWPIFKKNWGGFAIALAILYVIVTIMSVAMQIMFFTIVFLCLLPLFMPALSMYMALVPYTAFAQAYKEGRDRLTLPAPSS